MAGLVQTNAEHRLGGGLLDGNPFGAISGGIFATDDQRFTTITDFTTQATYLAGIVNGSLIPTGEVDEVEYVDVEPKMQELQSGFKRRNMPAIRAYKLKFNCTPDQYVILKGLEGRKLKFYELDYANNIQGVKDGVKVRGFNIKPIIVDKENASTEKSSEVVILIQKSDVAEETKCVIEKPTWLLSDLEPITKVVITSTVISSNAVTATVAWVSDSVSEGGVYKTTPLTGALAANWRMINQSGSVQVVTLTESATLPGTYNVAGTSITSGSLQFVASTTLLFQSDVLTIAST